MRKPTSAQPDGRGGAREFGPSGPRAQAHEVLATKDTDAKLPTSDEVAAQFLPEGDEETPLSELEEETETADPAMPDLAVASEAFQHRAEPASDRVLTSAAALETAMRGSSTLPIGTGDGGPNMHDLAPQIGTGAMTVPQKSDPAQSTGTAAEPEFVIGQPKPASDAAKEQPTVQLRSTAQIEQDSGNIIATRGAERAQTGTIADATLKAQAQEPAEPDAPPPRHAAPGTEPIRRAQQSTDLTPEIPDKQLPSAADTTSTARATKTATLEIRDISAPPEAGAPKREDHNAVQPLASATHRTQFSPVTPNASVQAAPRLVPPVAPANRDPEAQRSAALGSPTEISTAALPIAPPSTSAAANTQTPFFTANQPPPASGLIGVADQDALSAPIENDPAAELDIPREHSLQAPGGAALRHDAPQNSAITGAHAQLISRQVTTAIAQMPDRPVEIALSPEELGRVRLVLHAGDHGMVVTVQAERPETLDLMRRNIEMLADDMRDLGYSDVSFQFGDHPQNPRDETQATGFDAPGPEPEPDMSPRIIDATPIMPATGSTSLDLRF
ncbi:hook-length control protein FliK [Thioclava dalianensis]|nr:hook-length control protein FliK [Thioclava dalianensis]